MTTYRMITKWVTSLLVLGIVAQACSGNEHPVAPRAVSSGTLIVSIRVTGTAPDPRGYVVVVHVAGEGDYPPQTVPMIGGTVLFPDLPPGTHSVRLESLAENCSVVGPNPRHFTLAGGTSQVGVTVACPGVVLLKTVTTGDDLDSDGYSILFDALASHAAREVRMIGTNDSLLISEKDIPPAASWIVRLDGIAANCWSTSPNPVALPIGGAATPRIEFSLKCTSWIALWGNIYYRVSPHHPSTLSVHGSLSERYIFYENGSFRLEFSSGVYGDFEYPGSYWLADSVIELAFHDDHDNGTWAIGTLRGDSLFVEYHPGVGQHDFEDGVYVRYPQTP